MIEASHCRPLGRIGKLTIGIDFNHPAVAFFWLCGIEVIVRRFFTGQVSAPRSPAAGAVIERALDGGWQDAGCRAADPIGIVAGMAFVVFGASLDRPGAVAAFCHFDNGYANGREGQGLLFGRSRSEEHTSELQSLMRISYAVFCLKKK